MLILNLTQHPATPEQIAEGVIDLQPRLRAEMVAALNFDVIPSSTQIKRVAEWIADLAAHESPIARTAMIGGAPYLMAPLERALARVGIEACYAFSVRESTEQAQADGSVKKVATFRHAGWVSASNHT